MFQINVSIRFLNRKLLNRLLINSLSCKISLVILRQIKYFWRENKKNTFFKQKSWNLLLLLFIQNLINMILEIALLLCIGNFKVFFPRSEGEGISLSVGLAVRPYVRPFVTNFCRIFSATINCKCLKSKKKKKRLFKWWDLFLNTTDVTFLVTSWFLSQ